MQRFVLTTVFTLICAVAGTANAQWVNLKGRIVFDGKAPAAADVKVTKDAEYCGQFGLKDESLVVNPKNGGVANVVVMLYHRSGKLKVHPDLEAASKEKKRIDNLKCRYEPHVVSIVEGQTLIIGNKDTVGHNSKVDGFNNSINPNIPAGAEIEETFKEESAPIPVSCSIHPWMKAWLVVKEHPYVAVTDEDGNFELKNLPAGKLKFQIYQEKAGYLTKLKIDGAKWGRRDFELDMKSSKDLGEVKITSKDLKL